MKPLIPLPKVYRDGGGEFAARTPMAFNLPEDCDLSERSLRLAVGGVLKLEDKPSDAPPDNGLRLVVGDPNITEKGHVYYNRCEDDAKGPEAYRLRVEAQTAEIVSTTADGLLDGLRTLAQLAVDGPVPQCEIVDWPDMTMRGAHYCYHLVREDLAYNVMNFDSTIARIDRLGSVKMNAALLEMEALFPFRKHKTLTNQLTFTEAEIVKLRERLTDQRMEIVPLVQCLGHAYAVLAHEEYAEYAELPGYNQQYCPTNPKVADLYMEFVDEYLEQFPDIKYWHLGGDESRMLGRCPRCKEKIEREGVSRLYIDHVVEIARRVHERGLTPIVWHDMIGHHPEAMDEIPEYVAIMYWNYDFSHKPVPQPVDLFHNKKFRVMSANGVRWGGMGTELSLYYSYTLRGLETLAGRMYQEGHREIVTTSWMKGSPHESEDYGFLYGAENAWNIATERQNFQRRYAGLTHGVEPGPDQIALCALYETLSLRLPYAETVHTHMPDYLDRFNLSGFKFPEKWKTYQAPDKEPETLELLRRGLERAREATAELKRLKPAIARNERLTQLLALSAQCIEAKARLALALHEGHRFEAEEAPVDACLKWLAEAPPILDAWREAKHKHLELLIGTSYEPCVENLNEMMFETEEEMFFEAMAHRLKNR